MQLYLDDIRPTPDGWQRAHSVNEAISMVEASDAWDAVSLDHDLGDFAGDGGDAVRFVDWMVANGRFPNVVHIHTSNPVGRDNMRRTLMRHGYRGSGTRLVRET